MRILVLYTRLTGYWMACMRNDWQEEGNEYLVIRKKPSPDAPFQITSEKGITIVDGDKLDKKQVLQFSQRFNPDLVYVAGWADKRYLRTAQYFKKHNIPVITGMDNQWLGKPKQKLAGLLSPLLVRKYFSHIWIPGSPQHIFAEKLGFSSNNILNGLYCADKENFNKIEQRRYKKQILFIGRLVEHKGLKILFNVLEKLIREKKIDFEVHIIGNGPFEDKIPVHSKIRHTSFVEPEDLPQLLENAGFFILPSLYEAWGVVVHEAVLAGLPVITTQQTGAASEFVIHDHNGYIYDANSEEELEAILLKFPKLEEQEYLSMSGNSKALATRISLSSWSATINSLIS